MMSQQGRAIRATHAVFRFVKSRRDRHFCHCASPSVQSILSSRNRFIPPSKCRTFRRRQLRSIDSTFFCSEKQQESLDKKIQSKKYQFIFPIPLFFLTPTAIVSNFYTVSTGRKGSFRWWCWRVSRGLSREGREFLAVGEFSC